MKNKIFSLLTFSILAVLVLTSFASALTLTSSLSTLPRSKGTFTLTVANNPVGDISFTTSKIKDSKGNIVNGITFGPTYPTLSGNNSGTVNYTIAGNFAFEEKYTVTITATSNNGTGSDLSDDTTTNVTLSFEENTNFYDGKNEGDLEISDLEFDVKEGFGDEDNYWYPFDEVEVTSTIKNKGNYDIKNIEIQVCVFDETKGKCIFDEDDMEIDTNKFKLRSGKNQDVTMTFLVDADNLIAGNTDDYTFYIKVVGEIDDSSDSTYDGHDTGYSDSKEIEIVTDDTFVIVNNIQFNPLTVSCGGNVEITADVWNIDDRDLDNDEIYVLVYSKELGINQVVEFSSGIDLMESEKLTLSVQLLDDVVERTIPYAIKFTAYTDDSLNDKDIFETGKGDGEKASYQGLLTVEGSCSTFPTASVSALLESDAKAGQDLIVKATIVNTASTAKTFKVSASGYADWASTATLDKTSVTINAGESKDVLINLKVMKDVSGEKTFNIEVLEGNKFLAQPVKVVIEKSLFSFPNITGFLSNVGGDNLYLWGIIALNAVLVLVIIIVAVRVLRKK